MYYKQTPHPNPLPEGEGVASPPRTEGEGVAAPPLPKGDNGGFSSTSRGVRPKTGVVGIGNVLMRDDGVGVHAIRELQKRELPDHISCIDGGTASFDAIDVCIDCGNIIVIDAIRAGGKPGTIYRMTIDHWRNTRGISLHDVTLLDAVSMTEISTGRNIPVTVIGIEPEQITPGLDLSQPVLEKLNDLVDRVIEEIGEDAAPTERQNELERVEQ